MKVLRWGQSAYETEADMAAEREHAERLGMGWHLLPNVRESPTQRADVLVVTSKVKVDGTVLDVVAPQLVLTTTSGFEHIDLEACAARGVLAARSPLARRDAVCIHQR